MKVREHEAVLRDETEETDPLDLIARLMAGERSALAEVYDRHHAELRRFARRFIGDASSAEDLVHDVFLALPHAIRRFEGRSSLRTFLVSIAVNHCRNHLRAAVRRRRALAHFAEDVEGSTAPPETRERRLADALARALDELPVDQRAVFVLSALEERAGAEIAAILGVPEATVRTRLLRARQKLAASLAKEGLA